MILAIVGTRTFTHPKGLTYAKLIIHHEIVNGGWDSIVTGDAQGVDRAVAFLCALYKFPCETLKPNHRRWEPDGYKDRDIKIAETCDQLLAIRDPTSKTFGSGWTAKHAQSIGKPVLRVDIT